MRKERKRKNELKFGQKQSSRGSWWLLYEYTIIIIIITILGILDVFSAYIKPSLNVRFVFVGNKKNPRSPSSHLQHDVLFVVERSANSCDAFNLSFAKPKTKKMNLMISIASTSVSALSTAMECVLHCRIEASKTIDPFDIEP